MRTREQKLEQQHQWYLRNKDRIKEKRAAYYLTVKDNPTYKNRKKETGARYLQENLHKHSARQAKRNASKIQATPSWLTEEQIRQIEYFYFLARDLGLVSGERYHVDHIIPLRGKTVCGLHVPWNLQILHATDNLTKGNRI